MQVSQFNGVLLVVKLMIIHARCVPQENTKLTLATAFVQIACQTNILCKSVLQRIHARTVQKILFRGLTVPYVFARPDGLYQMKAVHTSSVLLENTRSKQETVPVCTVLLASTQVVQASNSRISVWNVELANPHKDWMHKRRVLIA